MRTSLLLLLVITAVGLIFQAAYERFDLEESVLLTSQEYLSPDQRQL